uniref:Uncharacterized protein n=1 Tax=Anguilla anguilla TaxID=7936 RepID=A0A0E9VMQ6_ANGAN
MGQNSAFPTQSSFSQ